MRTCAEGDANSATLPNEHISLAKRSPAACSFNLSETHARFHCWLHSMHDGEKLWFYTTLLNSRLISVAARIMPNIIHYRIIYLQQ